MTEAERKDWLESRRKGIGGSDVGPIMGLSTWSTAYDVWKEKVGLKPIEERDTKQQAYGKMLEDTLRQWYVRETGREVVVPEMLVHPKHEFMLANLDGVTGDRRVVEIKTSRSGKDWGEPGSNVIPVYYAAQVQHYMIVTGIHVADVVVSIAGSMPEIYEIPEDIEMQRVIVDAETEFWQLVQSNRPPEPVTFEDAMARFGGMSQAGMVQATDDAVEAWKWIRGMKDIIGELEEQMKKRKAVVMNLLGDSDTLVDSMGNVLVTWKLAKGRKAFDKERFEAERPELFAEYVREQPGSRRFLPK